MIITVLVVLGLCFGSFVSALVWRLHKKRDFVRERSECTHCHHVLAWYDLVPVLSWLLLKGKCRYCQKRIEDSPLVELITAGLFAGSYLLWPYGFTPAGLWLFGLWLLALVFLVALAVYDARWMLLPNKLTLPLIGLGLIMGGVRYVGVEGLSPLVAAGEVLAGVGAIAGVYGLLYLFSRGAWIGLGDVKLAIFIGAVLGWQQALLTLFLSNLLALIAVLPSLLGKKLTARTHVPFGPFLIGGCIIAFLIGGLLIEWYLVALVGL